MSKPVTAVELSKNGKIGPASATYASQVTCPSGCPFRDNGCYGEAGNVGYTTRRLNKSEATAHEAAQAEADGIDGLTGLMDLRLHVVGDCVDDESARIVSAAAMRFKRRRRPTDVWTYHHAWRDVARASWGGVSVLASCHSEDECKEAMDRGYAASMTVEKLPKKAYKKDGVTYFPCAEQNVGKTCIECRACFSDTRLLKKKLVLLLEIHTSTNKANAAQSAYVGG